MLEMSFFRADTARNRLLHCSIALSINQFYFQRGLSNEQLLKGPQREDSLHSLHKKRWDRGGTDEIGAFLVVGWLNVSVGCIRERAALW